jgi:uroporphyrinogen decarboxylase
MHGNPELWNALLSKLADVAGAFLRLQVENGASAVQLFDSWVGALGRRDYEQFVLPHSRRALSYVGSAVPRIHFGVNTGELLASMATAGTDVVGVDFRLPLNEAALRVGPEKALQGNLDPAILFAPPDVVDAAVDSVLDAASELPGHIFNLGHGVLPTTNPEVLQRVVERVHQSTTR